MKLHEYQARDLLQEYGISVPPGRVAENPEQAAMIARELGGKVVVKAQVLVTPAGIHLADLSGFLPGVRCYQFDAEGAQVGESSQ